MYRSGPRAPFKAPRPLGVSSSQISAPSSSPVVAPKPKIVGSIPNKTATKTHSSGSSQSSTSHFDGTNPAKRQKVEGKQFYIVQWRKKTTKKNKTWDGDGYIVFNGSSITFKCDVKGTRQYRAMGSVPRKNIDGIISIGSYEIEVDYEIKDQRELEELTGPLETVKQPNLAATTEKVMSVQSQYKKMIPTKVIENTLSDNDTNNGGEISSLSPRQSVHDPNGPDSLVMKKIQEDSIDVVVDPILSKALRPHQQEGIRFLYECVMGMRRSGYYGALLADEMGLGKTLMTISLLWTLLRQTPYPSDRSPICKKILIACPVTLLGNWKREFKKWLGMNRVSVLTLNSKQTAIKDKQDVKNFGKTRVYQVLIMSYEKITSCQEELKSTQFDLLVCDEGHRLKNSSNKAVQVFNGLNIKRKVLLTGTPMQNDLVEFFNIVNFINPGVLGTFASFQRDYLKPILRSREVNCINQETIQRGESKSKQLVELTKDFTLRRTSAILSNYLTSKTDLVLFCPPTKQQVELFKFIFNTQKFKRLISNSNGTNSNDSLAMITLFKKICNSPSLLSSDKIFQSLNYKQLPLEKISSKINVLIPLLLEIRRKGDEKTVIISNYTQTLDLLEDVLNKLNISFLRLDGSTPNKSRDKLVSDFNTLPISSNSVFLLSAKSGGVGLNLIGGSRLVLFDNDWNPAVDLQAMARIHRDGQKKPVFIYRLMTTGCIDEKIFQRQLMKNSLSDTFVDNKSDSKTDVFEMSDLKDLFTVSETKSNTHDLLECDCCGIGEDLAEEDGEEVDEDNADAEEEEEEEETISDQYSSQGGGWMSALNYKQDDKTGIKKKASIRNALVEYNHYDPACYDKLTECGDPIVDAIIRNSSDCPLTYLLTKSNREEIILEKE
ncbi:DNA repair and recombination protein Rdh54p [[Candida] anglica]|uniref:DNA repair and recombination protein Rdh54p n=1 Tax=[Candida] anglica TaxID=148631 RepID=A0ABP0EAR3_9ASCO